MLAVLDLLLVLHVPWHVFHEDLLHDLLKHGGEAQRSVFSCLYFLLILKIGVMFPFIVTRNFVWLLWIFKCDWEWLEKSTSQFPLVPRLHITRPHRLVPIQFHQVDTNHCFAYSGRNTAAPSPYRGSGVDTCFQCGSFGSNLKDIKVSHSLKILKIIIEFEIADLIT